MESEHYEILQKVIISQYMNKKQKSKEFRKEAEERKAIQKETDLENYAVRGDPWHKHMCR